MMLTEEKEKLVEQFKPPVSKIDKERKTTLRHVSERGSSLKKMSFEERKDSKVKDTFDLSDGGNQTLQRY